MKGKYNVKVTTYKEQTTVSVFDKPILKKDGLESIIIYLKKFRSMHSVLIFDNQDGTGIFECDEMLLKSEKQRISKKYGTYINTMDKLVPNEYTAYIVSDEEKQERNIISSLNRTKGKVYDLSYANDWSHFITLTFNDDLLMQEYGDGSWNYDVCCKALHQYLVDLRRKYNDVVYLGVPEQHKFYYDTTTAKKVFLGNEALTEDMFQVIFEKINRTPDEQDVVNKIQNGVYRRRFHFHFLFNNYPTSQMVVAKYRNGQPHRTKNGLMVYNLNNYKWGYTTATKVQNLAATQHYITKYISKELISVSKGRKRYWASKNIKKPDVVRYDLTQSEKETLLIELSDLVESESRKKEVQVKGNGYENIIHKYVVLASEMGQNTVSDLAVGNYYIDEDENDDLAEYERELTDAELDKMKMDYIILKQSIEEFRKEQDKKSKKALNEIRRRHGEIVEDDEDDFNKESVDLELVRQGLAKYDYLDVSGIVCPF